MKTKEELLEDLRKQSKQPGSMANLMYSLLETAHPAFKENFENQAVMMMDVGQKMAKEMIEADKDPVKSAQLRKAMENFSGFDKKDLNESDTKKDS